MLAGEDTLQSVSYIRHVERPTCQRLAKLVLVGDGGIVMADGCNYVTLGGQILGQPCYGGRHVAVAMRNDYQRVGLAGRWCVSDGNPGDCEISRRSRRLGR